MRLIDINTSIRSQIDTVFSNVYDIDKKYGSIFQNYAEIVERQKQRIDDMTAVLREGNDSRE